MGKVLLIVFGISLAFVIGYIFFGGKKKQKKDKKSKDKKQEDVKEKKIEPAIKSNKQEDKSQNKVEEAPKVEMPTTDSSGFKIIRKQSKVKINKKALQNGSRNPSVTKVFDKNKSGSDFSVDKIEPIKEEVEDIVNDNLDIVNQSQVDRFGAREINYNVVNRGNEFSIKNREGDLNRAPIITDRTNFGSHLNVSEDNNFLGVTGTGIKEINETNEKVKESEEVDEDVDSMVKNVKRNFLGLDDDINPFDYFNRDRRMETAKGENKKEIKIKDIDLKTLIIADAINNPKYKNKK